MARTELAQRWQVAAVGIPLVVLALYVGRWVMGPVLAAICAAAALELYRLAEARGVQPLRIPGMLGAMAVLAVATVRPSVAGSAPALWTLSLVLMLGLALVAIPARGVEGRPLPAVAVTTLGALLPAGAMAYAIYLRHLPVESAPIPPVGTAWVGVGLMAYPLMTTWLTDSAAFFAGRRWGRTKLVPAISPGKTVVGGVAGLVGGTLGGLFMAWVYQVVLGLQLPLVLGAVGGLGVSVLSQAGDLSESVWKREAGVKDSGTFFPGHGGFLDRMDSLLFTIPASYWWLALILGSGAP